MEDENEPTATPDADATTVEVTVTPPETSEPDAADVVVVEAPETGNPATEAVLVETAIDEAGRIARLEAAVVTLAETVEALRGETAEAIARSTFAMEEATEAVQVAETPEPEPATEQASPEQDSEPNREHPFFRPIFGGSK
jgi:hypothetical protein